jgi:lysyl-tRNA synthetase, class I
MNRPPQIEAALLAHTQESKAWPFEEARKVLGRLDHISKPAGAVIFETGYGPSGLPHIGTFGEVARTTMVRHAFRVLTEDKVPTRLICFSDDMDGLRKVPDNIPNKEMLAAHLGKPLTQVPDPFGEHPSFGHHNNARLRAFLDTFGFDYEFLSATECYASGRFDRTLIEVLRHYDAIRDVILPTLGPERRATYSPFLPISRRCRRRRHLQGPRHPQAHASSRDRGQMQAAMEGRLGHALDRARRRLRDGGQGSDRLGPAL